VVDSPLVTNTAGDRPPAARIARLFASPAGVLIILPALVIAAGIAVMLLGRRATRETAEQMARHQLVAQASAVEHDVVFALDQAEPVLATMKTLADAAMPTPDALARLRDTVLGRPGIWNASISFPVGVMWGTYIDKQTGALMVHESRVDDSGVTTRKNYARGNEPDPVSIEITDYDPRKRPQYAVAVEEKRRVWMPPRVLSGSGKTGITVSEPLYRDGELAAVLTLDFDVVSLSEFIRKPPLAGARNVMFTADGTILAYPAVALPAAAAQERRLLRHTDFTDPALVALFAARDTSTATQQRFMPLTTGEGDYFASIAALGGKRAGSDSALDWYLATLVPEATLFGPMKRLNRDSIIASGAALAIAMGVALMFAWNILRMRRTVAFAREQARSAEARARQLGSYRLVEKLGAGGMGEVWRAEHQLLARKAAIKLVRKDVLRDREHASLIQERFRREAQTLASMRSRHTIELYDYGMTDDGTFFYVMELLDGLDLAVLVRDYGPQPAARVIRILVQACQSLAEAHGAGLLHRDVKPANLELCRAADEVDIIKVLDFGIVHNIADPVLAVRPPALPRKGDERKPTSVESGERLTTEGVVIGTPGYIPPEQAVAAPLDPRGDIYALACVGWYLLTGGEVYPRRTEEEVLRAHVLQPIPPLRDKVDGWLPHELEMLMYQCLAKEPEQRPDARTMARALSKIPIPAEHAWTDDMAQAWWASMHSARASSPDTETAPGRVLVPARAETEAPETRRGVGPEARTIEARRSSRDLG
jgi:serine/threonine protein kinase